MRETAFLKISVKERKVNSGIRIGELAMKKEKQKGSGIKR
jgi:hypothetical protein